MARCFPDDSVYSTRRVRSLSTVQTSRHQTCLARCPPVDEGALAIRLDMQPVKSLDIRSRTDNLVKGVRAKILCKDAKEAQLTKLMYHRHYSSTSKILRLSQAALHGSYERKVMNTSTILKEIDSACRTTLHSCKGSTFSRILILILHFEKTEPEFQCEAFRTFKWKQQIFDPPAVCYTLSPRSRHKVRSISPICCKSSLIF